MPIRASVFALLACPALAAAQSSMSAVFVANNGNAEGSVTSFALDEEGVPTFVDRVITGGDDSPGTNPVAMSITPDGRFLATGHATGNDVTEQITIIEVQADATLSIVGEFPTPDSCLAVHWVTDTLLAAAHTSLSETNEVLIYEYDREANTLTLVDSHDAGEFLTTLAVRDDGKVVYANDSFFNQIYVFSVSEAGDLELLQVAPTGVYPLGIELSPNGSLLYGAGGISAGGDKVIGFAAAQDGTLTQLPGSPFVSPGESPKGSVFSADGSLLFVEHGTDSTIRSFFVDAETGELTSTGFGFDVGLQGTLGGTAVLGDWLFVTDDSPALDDKRGLYSFTYLDNGGLTPNGPIVDTQGVSPEVIVVWPGSACAADFNGDGELNILDFVAFQEAFASGDESADCTGDGELNILDFICFQKLFQAGCA